MLPKLFREPVAALAALLFTITPTSLEAKRKPKEPERCDTPICFSGLKWQNEYQGFAVTGYHIEGTLMNGFGSQIELVRVEFDVYSGTSIIGNSSAFIQAVPVQGSWFLTVPIYNPAAGSRVITKIQPARISFRAAGRVIRENLAFEPICNLNIRKSCQ